MTIYSSTLIDKNLFQLSGCLTVPIFLAIFALQSLLTIYLNFTFLAQPSLMTLEKLYKQIWSQFDQENFILVFFYIDWNSSFESCGYVNPIFALTPLISKLKGLLDQHLL